MKTWFYLIIIFMAASGSGCSSEEVELPFEKGSVLGSWDLKEVSLQGAGTANVAISPFPVPVAFSGNGADYGLTLIFEENEHRVTALGSFNLIVQVSAVGINVGTQTLPIIGSEAFRGTWSQNGNELVLAGSENTVSFQLNFFEQNGLIMKGNPNLRQFEIEGGGIMVNEADMEFVFERIR